MTPDKDTMKRMLYNAAQFALLANAMCALKLAKIAKRRRGDG